MLLIDSGNSSIKCRLQQGAEASDHAFDLYRDGAWRRFGEFLQTLQVADIYLASVASDEIRQQIRRTASQHSRAKFHTLETPAQLGGLNNGYDNPQQLGIDRWLALLGASEISSHDAIIVDAGSAITIDLLSRRRGHLGGAILPGFNCDRARFERLFPALDFASLTLAQEFNPGRSTQACVRPQALPASSARIRQYLDHWRPMLEAPVDILLCGQDAERAAADLAQPYRIAPDLVFTGMLKQIACLG